MNKRKIQQISVTKLFGMFNHTIPLNMHERITCIHGPNGFGKTVLLTLLDDLFNRYYQGFSTIPFEQFRVDFDDHSYIRVEQKQAPEQVQRNGTMNFMVSFWKPELSEEQSFQPGKVKDMATVIEQTIPGVDRIDASTWVDQRYGREIVSLEDILDRYGHRLPEDLLAEPQDTEWKELKKSLSIRFIKTQRLLTDTYHTRFTRYQRKRPTKNAVEVYAQELAEHIETKLAEYAARSQSLDRTFPKRLLEQNTAPQLTDDELREKLAELEKNRLRFIAAGLLDASEDMSEIPEQIREGDIEQDTKGVLAVYVQDVAQKLGVLDDIADKIDLFQNTVNKRFLYKKMKISQKSGFSFTDFQGNSLDSTDLSSGEQHELIMLYEFLFKAEPGTLFLIDEPEISLHVAWQSEFLKDLQAISASTDIDFLIATHSPDIISNRWDVTVQLQGPEHLNETAPHA